MYETSSRIVSGQRVGWSLAAAALMAVASPAWGAPISAPHSEDFNDGLAQNFGTYKSNGPSASDWTLTGTAYQHALAHPGSGLTQFTSSTVQVDNLGAPADFVVQATVNVSNTDSTVAASVAKVGLVGLAKNGNVAQWNTDALYYTGELAVAGNSTGSLYIRRGRGNNSVETIASGVALPSFSLNTTYLMTFIGDYDGAGNLTLSFSIDDTTLTAAAIPAASVLTGQYFGIRDYTDNLRDLTATYDNFLVSNAVPEPASLALLGAGGVLVLARRRHA